MDEVKKIEVASKYARRKEVMTDEEISRMDVYISRISANQGHMSVIYDRWDKEEEAYKGDQPLKENNPNSRINIVNANIEGQVGALVEQNLSIMCRGESPGDEEFAEWATKQVIPSVLFGVYDNDKLTAFEALEGLSSEKLLRYL